MLFLNVSFCSNCGSHVLQLLHAPWWNLLPGTSASGNRCCCLLQCPARRGDCVQRYRCSNGSSPSWYNTPTSPRHNGQHHWVDFYHNIYKVPWTDLHVGWGRLVPALQQGMFRMHSIIESSYFNCMVDSENKPLYFFFCLFFC